MKLKPFEIEFLASLDFANLASWVKSILYSQKPHIEGTNQGNTSEMSMRSSIYTQHSSSKL